MCYVLLISPIWNVHVAFIYLILCFAPFLRIFHRDKCGQHFWGGNCAQTRGTHNHWQVTDRPSRVYTVGETLWWTQWHSLTFCQHTFVCTEKVKTHLVELQKPYPGSTRRVAISHLLYTNWGRETSCNTSTFTTTSARTTRKHSRRSRECWETVGTVLWSSHSK